MKKTKTKKEINRVPLTWSDNRLNEKWIINLPKKEGAGDLVKKTIQALFLTSTDKFIGHKNFIRIVLEMYKNFIRIVKLIILSMWVLIACVLITQLFFHVYRFMLRHFKIKMT